METINQTFQCQKKTILTVFHCLIAELYKMAIFTSPDIQNFKSKNFILIVPVL